jgi:predicted aspartyl protease
MGDVRVKVRMRNATDEELVRRNQLDPSKVHSVEAIALADTGAVCSVIPAQVAELLGVQIIGYRPVEYADGHVQQVGFTEPIRFSLLGRETAEEALVLGDEVLIGQTVLEKLDLLVDCGRQRVIPRHPEGFITYVKRSGLSIATEYTAEESELISR